MKRIQCLVKEVKIPNLRLKMKRGDIKDLKDAVADSLLQQPKRFKEIKK